ncbi:hypothetical protein [Bradyrhizobium sp. Ash2021]|uniref:hypothetical protein n=1 Tax=Bradyrhizobium sp. Ash2021 TaxID=2954771 RepID=UPI0028149BA6|nr:hypothetical protein [Bradyrhizobium sp. Ash2021]WMT75066.1 hypothetical protein NL528_01080 [Bradyrhizobium sp. Ash2021]
MADETTQQTIDDLAHEARMLAPSGKVAELDADIKAKANMPLETQARFLRGVIDAFESADLAKYLPEPPRVQNDGSRRRPEKTNPWSKEGWNISAQGKLVTTLGEKKAKEIAAAAGCKIGSTKFNPDYN